MYQDTWDLNSIYPGGLNSPQLAQRIQQLITQITQVKTAIAQWQFAIDQPNFKNLQQITELLQKIAAGLKQTETFLDMISSVEADNTQVNAKMSYLYQIDNDATLAKTQFQKLLVSLSDDEFSQIINHDNFKVIKFNLQEMRHQGQNLLDDKTEKLINDLAIDGFQGWHDHYDSLVAKTDFPLTENGKVIHYSAGQAQNKFESAPTSQMRNAMFASWEHGWQKFDTLFADTLNHLDGFRLTNYHAHGINDCLTKPLEENRMSKQTLDVMWQVVNENKQPFIDYLARKAQLLGLQQMGWQDQWAPINVGDFQAKHYSFDEAATFIIDNFAKISPKMAAVAQYAFAHRWIEAEDRPNKRPGGYMTEIPELGEFRIFMTFDGTPSEVSTIAHELGHGFHCMVMRDLPQWRQDYAMNVAETASTFAEMVVADATVKDAKTTAAKLNLLDQKMSNPLAMFLDIHARYIFEKNFYEHRQKGIVPVDQICEMMLTAQQQAYNDSLRSYDPYYWADKQHFFFSDVPFYNFPYTFGYLFSAGIYARAQYDTHFEDHYIALLRDTANMSTEELAQKHLNVDLTKPDFWRAGMQIAINDVNEFMHLSEEFI